MVINILLNLIVYCYRLSLKMSPVKIHRWKRLNYVFWVFASFCQFLPVKTSLNRQVAKTSFCREKCQPCFSLHWLKLFGCTFTLMWSPEVFGDFTLPEVVCVAFFQLLSRMVLTRDHISQITALPNVLSCGFHVAVCSRRSTAWSSDL